MQHYGSAQGKLYPEDLLEAPTDHRSVVAHVFLQGKLYTEDLLQRRGVNWTSVRPVYIYVSGLSSCMTVAALLCCVTVAKKNTTCPWSLRLLTNARFDAKIRLAGAP